jgi:hypothetical protein
VGLCGALLHGSSSPMAHPNHVVVFIRRTPISQFIHRRDVKFMLP